MSRLRLYVLAPVVFALLACGGAERSAPAPAASTAVQPSGVAQYFPLEDGRLYHYVTTEGGDTGMLVAKVHRTDAARGELRLSNGTKRFVVTPDAVSYDGGPLLLKAPLAVGASWPGEHGGTTRITTTDAAVDVPAGHYASCVTTVEEGGRLPGATYTTIYCPGVGMVLLVVEANGSQARAELKSYGMPVTIE